MHILIDVQNVLHSIDAYRKLLFQSHELAVNSLVHELTQYQDWTGTHLVLAFDGPAREISAFAQGIEMIFSGPQRSADSIIEQWVERNHSQIGDILVVTSDRALKDTIFASGARYTSPASFQKMMESELAERKSRKREKPRKI